MLNFRNYFVIYINKPFSISCAWHDSSLVKNFVEISANHSGAIAGFKTVKGEKIHLKVASSFISFEQADLNLEKEIGKDHFEATKQKALKMQKEIFGGQSKAESFRFFNFFPYFFTVSQDVSVKFLRSETRRAKLFERNTHEDNKRKTYI